MASAQLDSLPKPEPESKADALLRKRIIFVLDTEDPLPSAPRTAPALIGSWPIPSADFLSREIEHESLLQYTVDCQQAQLLSIWLERFPELAERLMEPTILASAMGSFAVDVLRVIHAVKPLLPKQLLFLLPMETPVRKGMATYDKDVLRFLQFLFEELNCTVAEFAAENAHKETPRTYNTRMILGPDARQPLSMAYLGQIIQVAPQEDLERAIPDFRRILHVRGGPKSGYNSLPSWFKVLMAAHPEPKAAKAQRRARHA